MTEACFFERVEDNKVRCLLCPHQCAIAEDRTGICRVRRNRAGILYAETYGRCASFALDPIEKKPLYHFYPGSHILSIGTRGCNLKCRFCQNYLLAHGEPQTDYVTPQDLVAMVKEKVAESIGIAYTYNEPLIWFEYLLETATYAKKQGLKNVIVSNGFINEKPLEELLPVIDAFNIDLKAFTEDFYQRLTGGELEPVKNTIVKAAKSGCHVEVTMLLVTGENDSREEVAALACWLAEEVGKDTPLHLSRYFPNYKMTAPPTPLETMEQAHETARQELHYVYLGNVPELTKSDTFCPHCGSLVISRRWGSVRIENLRGNRCQVCGAVLNIIR